MIVARWLYFISFIDNSNYIKLFHTILLARQHYTIQRKIGIQIVIYILYVWISWNYTKKNCAEIKNRPARIAATKTKRVIKILCVYSFFLFFWGGWSLASRSSVKVCHVGGGGKHFRVLASRSWTAPYILHIFICRYLNLPGNFATKLSKTSTITSFVRNFYIQPKQIST